MTVGGTDKVEGVGSGPSRNALLLLALAVGFVLSFAGIFSRDLWTPDEPRLAEMGRVMAETPGWSPTPMLAGAPFLEQPPLCVWSVAASYEVFGVSPSAARVPMAIYGVLLFLIVFLLGERAAGPLAGCLAAAVLGTFARFISKMHGVIPDIPLALFVAAGHLAFLAARDRMRAGRRPTPFLLLGLFTGLAFLSKGPIGTILIAGPLLLATALTDRPLLVRAGLWTALAGGAGVALLGVPWVLALARESGWDAVRENLLGNTLGRIEGNYGYGHAAPVWYYLSAFPVGLAPWLLLAPAVLRSGVAAGDRGEGRVRFLGLAALAGVLLLSIPSSKRAVYLLPLLPATAVVGAAWLAAIAQRDPTPFERRSLAAVVGVTAAAALAGAVVAGVEATGGASLLPGNLEPIRTLPPIRWIAAGVALGAVGAAAARYALRVLRTAGPPPVLGAALSVVAAAAVFQQWVEPLADPLNSMRAGAVRAAALFPGDGPIPAMGLSENTRSIVPFYSGRPLRVLEPGEVAVSPVPLLLVDEREGWRHPLEKRGVGAEVVHRVPIHHEHALLVVRPLPH